MLNIQKIRAEFPIFQRKIHGKSLVYLDNAATSQKPRCVMEAIQHYYETMNANVHRGIHTLSEEATESYERTRRKIAEFIHANCEREIIFTKNCTEAINLVAGTFGKVHIGEGDQIIVSALEHHSNLVPWQELAREKKAKLEVIPLQKNETLRLDLKVYEDLLAKGRTKLVCLTGMSNAIGVMPPLKKMIALAHQHGALVLVDGAQYIVHSEVDVRALDCEFFTFSAHKMLGPMGVGVLYGKLDLLESLPPFLYGGDMVLTVSQFEATYNESPWKFEAGTPNVADVVAFEKALDFLNEIGIKNIEEHGKTLLKCAKEKFTKYDQVRLYTPDSLEDVGPVLSFNVEGVHAHDVASIFNEEGVAIRSGQHCAEPLLKRIGMDASARMSFYLYNTEEDIERAVQALDKVMKIFKVRTHEST